MVGVRGRREHPTSGLGQGRRGRTVEMSRCYTPCRTTIPPPTLQTRQHKEAGHTVTLTQSPVRSQLHRATLQPHCNPKSVTSLTANDSFARCTTHGTSHRTAMRPHVYVARRNPARPSTTFRMVASPIEPMLFDSTSNCISEPLAAIAGASALAPAEWR
jgi:hypothetical protein